MVKNEKFNKLCLRIWQEDPLTTVIVKLGDNKFQFAVPVDGKACRGMVEMSESELMRLLATFKTASRIIKQRGSDGSYVIPDVDKMDKDRAIDY